MLHIFGFIITIAVVGTDLKIFIHLQISDKSVISTTFPLKSMGYN